MKTLNIILLAIGLLLMTASCTKEEAGITYEVLNPEVLDSRPGDTHIIELVFTDEDGLSQIFIESKDLGIDTLQNFSNNPPYVLRNIEVTIPDSAKAGMFYSVLLDVSDAKGLRLEENFDIEIIE